jgi:MtN3 and saliva related transmembrane protein
MIQWVGFAAGFLTTLSFVPQVIKAYRTRSTEDLSLAMLITFSVGLALWVAYGAATYQTPVVITNVVTLFLVAVLLWVKITPNRP